MTASMLGRICAMSLVMNCDSSIVLMRSRAWDIATSTRLPREAASTAREAATVVLPVPPLPMTARKRRSRRSDAMRGDPC